MQARLLPAPRGVFWIAAGFLLYRRNPPLLSLLTFANMLLALLFSQLQPIGPFLLVLASPLVIALMANACAAIAAYGPLQVAPRMLLSGLREHARSLVRLGMVQMVYMVLVVFIVDRLLPGIDPAVLASAREAADAAEKGAGPAVALDPAELGKLVLHLGAIGLAVLPAFWFAPLLTAWHGVAPLKAVFFSLVAVWRNWRAFLVYAVAAATIAVLAPALLLALFSLVSGTLGGIAATVLQLLVLLVFAPVLTTGAYCSYRDIFAPADAPSGAADPDSSDGLSADE